MSWNIFEVIDVVLDMLNLLSGSSASDWENSQKIKKRKKSRYRTEWVSSGFTLIGSAFLALVIKDLLPMQHPFQLIIIATIIGVFVTSICCFTLYALMLFYFKSLFSMVFFCCSLIFFFTALVLCVYFKSSLFFIT